MPAGTGIVVAPATGSVFDRCMQDLALIFQAMNLSGSSQAASIGSNVYVKSLADDLSDVTLPAVLVTCEGGEEMLDTEESFEEFAWGYPCAVLIIDSASPIDPNIRPDYLRWRHDMMAKVRSLPASTPLPFLPSTPECYDLVMRPKSPFEEWQKVGASGLPTFLALASSFTVICHCEEKVTRA